MLRTQIENLRKQKISYRKIAKILGISLRKTYYNSSQEIRDKEIKKSLIASRKQHPFFIKLHTFKSTKQTNGQPASKSSIRSILNTKVNNFQKDRKNGNMNKTFTVEDVINKFGENPKCYLTGESIDIYKPKTYSFDHIIPSSRGGDNSIDNLGICTKQANQAKSDMTKEEFIEFCKKVVKNNT